MLMKRKLCQVQECNNPVWSKGMCQNHSEKTPMKKSAINITVSGRRVGRSQSQKRYRLFMEIWKERGNTSEVSGTIIYGEPSSAHFHHILPKNKYPEADLDADNIIILTMDEHANVESNMYLFAEVNIRRETLLKKYEENV